MSEKSLETRVAELEKAILKLGKVILTQDKSINLLLEAIKALTSRGELNS